MAFILPNPNALKDANGYSYQSTPELDQSPYLQSILNTFQSDKFTFRVHNLKAKGKIRSHRDSSSGLVNNIVRIHIPVTTNDDVFFYVDGKRVPMQNGECWFVDVTKIHEVENRSTEDRLQLMLDCDLNQWWIHLFKEKGIDLAKENSLKNNELKELQLIKQNLLMIEDQIQSDLIKKIDLAIEEKMKD